MTTASMAAAALQNTHWTDTSMINGTRSTEGSQRSDWEESFTCTEHQMENQFSVYVWSDSKRFIEVKHIE